MATIAENVIAAGSETRPPMLEKGMYDSWKTRIMLYIRGKENDAATDIRRAQRLKDLDGDDKLRYDSDIKAVNILLLRLPVDIYTLIRHYQTAKEKYGDRLDLYVLWKADKNWTKKDRNAGNNQASRAWVINAVGNTGTESEVLDICMFKGWSISGTTKHIATQIKNLNNHIAFLKKNFETLKQESSEKYEKNISEIVDLENAKKELENIVFKVYVFIVAIAFQYQVVQKKPGSELGSELTLLAGSELKTNELDTSKLKTSEYRNQAIVQDGRVVVQNVQGRHNKGQGNNAWGVGAAGYEGAQNKVGNANPGDHCYDFDSDVNEAPTAQTMFMANLSSTNLVYDEAGLFYDLDILSEVHNHDHYQDVICDHQEEHEMHDDVQPNYVVDSHTNYTSDSNMIMYDQYVKDNAMPVVKIVDKSLTAELATYKEQVELYERWVRFELTKREQKIDEQLRIVITEHNIKEENLKKELHSIKMKLAFTINHNKSMVEEVTSLKKDFKQKENKYLEEFLDMKALKEKVKDKLYKQDQSFQTVHMLCKPKPYYTEQNKVAIGYKNPLCLTRGKQVHLALYNGYEIIKNNHVPALVHNIEDTLEIAEITSRKMNDKMKDPECVTHKVKIAPPDYLIENYLATFTPQKQLTPEQIFWSQDLIKMKKEALKNQTTASRPIKELMVYPPNTPVMLVPKVLPTKSQVKLNIFALIQLFLECEKTCKKRITPIRLTEGERGFEETKECYLTEVIPFFKTLKEHFEGIQKALTKEMKEMKDIFEELEAEVDQNVVNRKHDEIEQKNLLIANDNLIADCLAENEKFKQHYKELYDSIKITRAKHIEQTTALLTENENLKAQIHENLKCNTMESVKPRVLVPGRHAIDVEPIPPHNKNNREVHLHYLKHLKESVETLREIVEEAKVERPLDRSIISGCRYTKHSQELLEYVIGTCPKAFNQRDKKHAPTPLIRKNQVTFDEQCDTSNCNTHKHVEQLNTQKTNVLVPPSTGVNCCANASGSQLRSNTKKNKISQAKGVNKKKVEEHSRINKSNLKTTNRVDSNSSSKRTVVQIVLWYLDLGCPKHMTGDHSRLKNFVNKFIGTVRFGNDHFVAIMGYEDYVIGDSMIPKVYYVEGLGHNLFSVGQFCDSDLEVAFRKHSCYVRDTNDVELIKGSCGSNLYTISVEDMMKSSPICMLSKASKNKSWLWLHRLNHLNFGTINDHARKDLVRGLPRLKFEKDHLCSACQLGKRKKHTHKPKTKNTNLKVLNTLHMDLCGPISKDSTAERHCRKTEPYSCRGHWDNANIFQGSDLVHDKKPDLTFFRIFGALCYHTNDSEDLEKLQPTTDIGIFVGYAPNRKGYRIYNKRTRCIMETIHVQFGNLTELMAPVQLSTGPAPMFLTPGQISSGLIPNLVPAEPYVPLTNKQLEILFQPMFDEYLEPPRVERPVSPTPAVPIPVNLAGTPSSTTIDQGAPSPSHSTSSSALQSLSIHQGIIAESTLTEENPFAPIDNDPFINIFAPEPTSETSSSGVVSSTESTYVTQTLHHLGKWSKDHPLDNVIVKLDEYGDVLKNNARLVAKGYRQEEGIDFAGPNVSESINGRSSSLVVVDELHQIRKTYYELLKGKKPEVNYFRVFGSLYYPTNDYDDLGKLKAKADIGRMGSGLVPTPTTPSVPPTEKQLSELFQLLYDEDKEFPLKVQPQLVYVAPPHAPEIAPDSPSMTTVTEDAPITTTITSPLQSSPPDTSIDELENTITTPGSDSFKNSVTYEFDSEASSSDTTHLNNPPLEYAQKWLRIICIGIIWVYKFKLEEFGDVLKNKASVSAKASQDMTIFQMDVKTAFLNGELNEVVYAPRAWYDKLSRGIFINQSKDALEILKKYGLNSSASVDTPMAKPTEKHLHAIKQIFRYLKGTIHMGLWYPKDSGFALRAFADADYVGCQDTRRKAVATACYTQNRSRIHTLHNKTPYELVHDKKPDLTFFCVFSALCYPTNNCEDLGKLQPITDIRIFVGYAPSRKGTGHASTFLMPGQISSGIVPNPILAALYVPPTNKELEILFQPMFDFFWTTTFPKA
ncbi:retrovirus-related pol polyprotein from transposon TNT 1-94 [Tanacetum coccineum]